MFLDEPGVGERHLPGRDVAVEPAEAVARLDLRRLGHAHGPAEAGRSGPERSELGGPLCSVQGDEGSTRCALGPK